MDGSAKAETTGAISLGKYRLIAELGHGGMAEVFLAVVRGPAGFNKLVVLKQIRPQLAEDPELLDMFLDEARLAARLNHPNVVQTNEVGQERGRYFIAMEYLEGQPLNRVLHRLQRDGGLPLHLHLRAVSEVLAGLHHAHEIADYDGTPLGVVHRDVTPHNIFITYDGQVKVVDFGIAKALNSSSETRTGVLKGKVAYMAPEQARGEPVDRRADLFSIGILLWEAATGTRMWKGVPDLSLLQRLLNGDIPTPRSISPDVPERLEAIILKCLALDREDRYATALDLQAALDAHLDAQEERGTARDLGKLLAKSFDADRVKIKGIIEAQLRSSPAEVVNFETPNLPSLAPPVSLTATGSHPNVLDPSIEVGPISMPITSSGSPPSHPLASTSGLFASAKTSDDDGPPRRRGVVAVTAIAASGLLALGFWINTRTPAPPVVALATPAATMVIAAPPAVAPRPTAAPQIEISVAASPPEARLFLDDRPLGQNPFKGSLTAEPGPHQLRVEALGYTTQSKSIVLDRNVVLELVLQKDPGIAKPTGRLQGSPPVSDNAMIRPTAKPRRTLDTSNPYAK
jgi:serine/threonine protein kinase